MKTEGIMLFTLTIVLMSSCDSTRSYAASLISASLLPTLPTTLRDSKSFIPSSPIETCNEPLGMQSDKISVNQINQGSYWKPETAATNARLNKTDYPQGYLSDDNTCGHSKTSGYVAVTFNTKTVVTAIATQGYGDESRKDWVKSFSLYWKKSSSTDEQYALYKPPYKFTGNSDANTIVYNRIPQPKEVKSILLIPIECNQDKVGLRMELYGCVIKKTYVLWIRLMGKQFHKLLFSPKSQLFEDLESSIKSKVERLISSHKGFLFVNVLHISPGSVIVQLEVGAAEAEAESLIQTANRVLNNDKALDLDPNFFLVQDLQGSKGCRPPAISLSLSHQMDNPTLTLKSEDFTVTSIIGLESTKSCSHNVSIEFEWVISRLPEGSDYFENRTTITKGASENSLKIGKRTLQYGIYYLEQRVGIPKTRLFNYNFGFFEVRKTPLRAVLTGPKVVARGYNDLIVMNASSSYDPEPAIRSSDGMTFQWFCKRQEEKLHGLRDIVSRSRIPLVHIPGPNEKLVESGCFGTGIGRINESGPILKLPVNKIKAGLKYQIIVIAIKDSREKIAKSVVKVDQVATMKVKISCKQNCGKYSPEQSMILQASCKGIICQEHLKYTWKVIEKKVLGSNVSWEYANINYVSTKQEADVSRISISKGILKVGVKYMLEVTAKSHSGTVAMSNFTLNANEAPRGGKCFVDARVGEAFTTVFNFTCSGWIDEEPPLTYKFQFTKPSGVEVLLQSSHMANVSTKLPVGYADNDYDLPMNVFIVDSVGVGIDVQIVVKVTPIKVENSTLYHYTVGEKSRLSVLLKNNNIKQATNLANEVLSMMSSDAVSNMTMLDKIKIKDNMINHMARVNVTDIKKLIQVASVVAGITENRTELSQMSQVKSVSVLESMTKAFHGISIEVKKGSARMVNEASTNLLHGMGNILDTYAFTAEAYSNKEELPFVSSNDTKKEKAVSKKTIKKVMKLIEIISDTLLSTMSPGERPARVTTKKIEMVVRRGDVEDIGKERLDLDGGGVMFPDSKTLFGSQNKTPSHLDTQILILKNNPFKWDSSANQVSTPVLNIELKDDSGKKLKIEGLEKEVELLIKTPPGQSDGPTLSTFCKPSVNGSMLYHTTNITGNNKGIHIILMPETQQRLEVFVGYRRRPTAFNYDFKVSVPDTSHCNKSENCTENYMIAVPANMTKYPGVYYIGVRNPGRKDSNVKSRRRRSCSEAGRQKRSAVCVEFKDPPTTPPPTPQAVIPSYDPTTDINYTISVSVKSCLYWSEAKEKWTNYGCRVSSRVVNDSLVCLCSHLSSFGGDFFVAPNPIDFDQVWAGLTSIGETKNFVVLATLCTIFCLYIVTVVFARRADRNDKQKITQAIPVSQITDDSYCYEITVYTGIWRRCGTTSNIAMNLCGEDAETGTISLSYNAMCDKQLFGRGSVNVFMCPTAKALGDLNHIRIWHDNSGDHPAWFLRQIVVRDIQTDTKCFFICNKWLAIEKEDGKIDRVLYVSTNREINGFKNKFCSRAATGIGDGHLWVSVVTRPPTSPFTRVQRATCCLCVLMTAMVTNAMFYQFGEESKDSFKFGPLVVSLKQIIIGIQSSIIVVPINILIVLLFKNARHKDENSVKPNEDDESSADGAKKKSGLPHFVVYIAWTLVILASLSSAAFTLFYSMMWGREISNQWLTSILVSFSQDVIFIQPIKVLIVAILLSFIIRKAPEEEASKDKNAGKDFAAKDYSRVAGEVKEPKSPKNEELEAFRQYRVRVLMMARTLIELFFYLTFVWMLMVICYGSRDVGRFWMTNGLQNILKKFDKVKNSDTFWDWSKNTLVPGLYNAEWYNGKEFEYKEGFISNRVVYLVGMPRLRQLRAVTDDCPVMYLYPNFTSTLNPCVPQYSFKAEDKTLYNLPGWFPLTDNETKFFSEFELFKICPRPWRYRTATDLHNLPFQGEKDLYGGGGYIADLGYTQGSALRVLENLQSNSWIDEKTRAIFVEFLVFEPSSSFFSAVTYLYEKPSMGGAVTYTSVKTMSLYGARSHGLQSLYAICELVIILIVIYFVIAELIKVYRQRWAYFKCPWTWVEITQVLAAMATIVLSIFRRYHATQLVNKVHKNPFKTSSFHYVVMWSEVEGALMAILIFIITIKLLRILKFNQHISVLAKSMAKCGEKLVSYSVVFLVAFLAFAQVAVLVFGSTVPSYSSVVQVFRSQFSMFVGGETDYQSLKEANGILGPIYFFVFMTAMATILINMFLAILNEAYREVHVFKDIVPEEYKMLVVFLDYADLRLRKSFAKLRETRLFPKKHKYEIKEGLMNCENENGEYQKYTAIEYDENKAFPGYFNEEDYEDNMISSIKGCFKTLRYDLSNLLSRSKTYKVHKASKMNKAFTPDLDHCHCQGYKMKAKSISRSLQNITDDFCRKKRKDEVQLLGDYDEGYDAIQDESDITYSDSESELYTGRYQLLTKPDRESNI
ncbi:polycystic kidney disease protein 1-like 2 isoform X3 [Actinia tenebrosa]|uniref:Polycystic kidney disease protein 1-like 2 isoform X3 n=1 Tax=Actinia tenebrosa TaxID=6105 RepID=A0A6P8J0D7_ACTTE|nr:polycystic kidney disease protein 1-like 2 isoform X3 [Actinia tenebrosa]